MFNDTEQIEQEMKEVNNLDNKKPKFTFSYPTLHLPYFKELREATLLEGKEYTPIIKAVYHSLLGVVLREKQLTICKLKTDPRTSVFIIINSGGGKKNIKQAAKEILEKLEYDVHVPLTLHSQQLIGKIINRGTPKKPEWIKNEGFLSRDFLIFDEAFELMTSKDQDIKESRRAIRISQDPIGQNLVEKKQVDNTFSKEERIAYHPKASMILFSQPKNYPADIVEEGDLRRDLVAYVRGLSDRDRSQDYSDRLKNKVDLNKQVNTFAQFLKTVASNVAGKEFSFTEAAVDRMIELHGYLVEIGFIHSEKGANFSKIVDYTLQDFFCKISCHIAAAYGTVEITPNIIDLAFIDLMEFFSMQLDFIKDKILGKLDYGEGWSGARGRDQECLEWLYQKGAANEESSKVSIKEFKKAISEIKGVSYNEGSKGGMAPKHYDRFKKNSWIDSKQVGQHDSKVWLTFKPRYVGSKLIIKGSNGCKGSNAYNNIISELESRIGEVQPLLPLQPSDVSEEEVK